MKIELHLLQNFAPSCLNRDDTNTPKSCEFGGVTRARISSQCFKRAIRDYFKENNSTNTGTRSKRVKQSIAMQLTAMGQDAEKLAHSVDAFVDAYYSKPDSKDKQQTAVLLYLSAPEIEMAARCILELQEPINLHLAELAAYEEKVRKAEKKAIKEKKPELPVENSIKTRLQTAGLSADIAMFGRMLAEQPGMNVDAACQVAHAISTHATDLSMDFYTAVDDLNPEGTGAGMLGVTGYNSACFYRYALLDRDQLVANLGVMDADAVIAAFLEAFVYALPTGKQNSMAAHSLPSLCMFVVREKGAPCSLANAFARPVRTEFYQDDLVRGSQFELSSYWNRMEEVYGLYKNATIALCHDRDPNEAQEIFGPLSDFDLGSLDKVIETTLNAVRNGVEGARV